MGFTVRPTYNVYDAINGMPQEMMYERFIGTSDTSSNISSPLRKGDSNPSFRLRKREGGSISFIDYGTGKKGGIIDLVSRLFNVSSLDAAMIILQDFPIGEISYHKTSYRKEKEIPDIRVKTRMADDEDIRIWDDWGISKDTLKAFNVYPVLRTYLNNSLVSCSTRSYAYAFTDGWKIYRPFEKDMRFISQSLLHQGFDLLPERGDSVVIQKSYKDVMFMYECRIPSFAPHSEGMLIEKGIIENLRGRFKRIYIWGDNDESGRKFIKRHTDIYDDIIGLMNDDDEKDVTDSCSLYGKEHAIEMVKRIMDGK